MTKIKNSESIKGYDVGRLDIVVQGIQDSKTKKIIRGVFCKLNVMKQEEGAKAEVVNFVFSLDSIPSFKKHVVTLINQAIELKESDIKKKIAIKKKTIKKDA